MRGHIVKRYKDSYTIVLNLGRDPVTGKRKQQWVAVKGTKKDAEKKLAELLHQIDTGTLIIPGKITLGEFLERWLRDYAWPNLAPRTTEGYSTIFRQHIVRKLGGLPLTELKPQHLQNYYAEMLSTGRCDNSGGLSAQTVRHHHTVLHKALQTAVEWGLLSRNVASAVRAPHVKRQEMCTWDVDDVSYFLESARRSPYYTIFYLALFTGLRRSELLALRWQDVDFIFGQIYINRSLHHLKDGSYVFTQPKSVRSRRTVAMSTSVILALRRYKDQQGLERAALGLLLKEDDLVFSTLEGRPLRPNTITRAWATLAARCGLKIIRFHDARHTHASIMLKQGIHPKVVQERLGHSSIAVTLDTYSHITPGLQEAAAKRFDDAFVTKYNESADELVG